MFRMFQYCSICSISFCANAVDPNIGFSVDSTALVRVRYFLEKPCGILLSNDPHANLTYKFVVQRGGAETGHTAWWFSLLHRKTVDTALRERCYGLDGHIETCAAPGMIQ